MTRDLSIGIAGAGIGGLTAAALLARRGHRVTVFDQFASPRPVGSGLVIQPVGQAVLAEIGALPDALGAGARLWSMTGRETGSGRTVLDVAYGPPGGPSFGLAIHRAALFDLLHAAATAAGVEIVPAHRITGATLGTLHFEAGTSAGPFDFLVDATGARSPLSPLVSRPLPFGALWGTVPWPKDCTFPEGLLLQRYRRADRMVGVMPCGRVPGRSGPHATIFWSLPADGLHSWQDAGIAAWHSDIAALWPEALPFFAQIRDASRMTFATYAHGTLRRPIAPRLAMIGDAAHRASPQLGQGANMAMLDALALARALDGAPVDLALHHYAQARRGHVWLYQAMSRAFTPQYQSHSRLLPALRDRVLFPMSRIPPLPRVLTRLVCGTLLPPLGSLGEITPAGHGAGEGRDTPPRRDLT